MFMWLFMAEWHNVHHIWCLWRYSNCVCLWCYNKLSVYVVQGSPNGRWIWMLRSYTSVSAEHLDVMYVVQGSPNGRWIWMLRSCTSVSAEHLDVMYVCSFWTWLLWLTLESDLLHYRCFLKRFFSQRMNTASHLHRPHPRPDSRFQ